MSPVYDFVAGSEVRAGTSCRILIVEDDALCALAVETALVAAGFEVVGTASDGAAALALAETAQPDLALMDIRLRGGMDGLEIARALGRGFGVPSLFVSGSLDAQTRARAAALQPAGFVDKPYSEAELLSAVRAAFARDAAPAGRGEADAPRVAAFRR